jgi:hypothetical protein
VVYVTLHTGTDPCIPSAAELINKVNVYTSQTCPAAGIAPDALRLHQAARHVTRVLAVLGLTEGLADTLGFSLQGSRGGTSNSSGGATARSEDVETVKRSYDAIREDIEGAAGEHAAALRDAGLTHDALARCADADSALDALVAARDAVRARVKDGGGLKGVAAGVMAACDRARDDALVDVGVRLVDQPEGGQWMRVDPQELRKEARSSVAAIQDVHALSHFVIAFVEELCRHRDIESSPRLHLVHDME